MVMQYVSQKKYIYTPSDPNQLIIQVYLRKE